MQPAIRKTQNAIHTMVQHVARNTRHTMYSMQRAACSVQGAACADRFNMFVWISSAHAVTHTHFDMDHNFFVQLAGRWTVTGMLHLVHCVLHLACCALCVVCCILHVACCALHLACSLFCVLPACLLACCMLHVFVRHAVTLTLHCAPHVTYTFKLHYCRTHI